MATSSVSSDALGRLLDTFAAPVPSAGGGAAAAVTGALAAALLLKVCRVTAKGPSAAVMAEPTTLAARHRDELAALATADVEAYEAVVAARRLAGAARETALRASLRRATEIPLEIARAGAGVLTVAGAVAREVRHSVVSDLGVVAELAWATVQGGLVIARANLLEAGHTQDADAAFITAMAGEADRVERDAAALHGMIRDVIEARRRED